MATIKLTNDVKISTDSLIWAFDSSNLIGEGSITKTNPAGVENVETITVGADCIARLRLVADSTYVDRAKMWIDGVAVQSFGSGDTDNYGEFRFYPLKKGTVIGVSAYHPTASKHARLEYSLYGLK